MKLFKNFILIIVIPGYAENLDNVFRTVIS